MEAEGRAPRTEICVLCCFLFSLVCVLHFLFCHVAHGVQCAWPLVEREAGRQGAGQDGGGEKGFKVWDGCFVFSVYVISFLVQE